MACPGAQIAIVAVGTRGDVEPLLHLAAALQRGESGARVSLITHSAHAGFVEGPAHEAGLLLHLLPSPPARHWDATPAAAAAAVAAAADGGQHAASSSPEERHRDEVLAACQAALGCRLMGGGAVAATSAGPRLLIFNLFALEGWSIAEALRVPCAAASPCLVPYAPPASFQRRFQAAHPQLFHRLRQAPGGQVGWAEVAHWMWPLFNDERWGDWRRRRLSLPATPFSAVPLEQPLPPPTPLLYGVSDTVAPRPGYWPASVYTTGFWHAGAPSLAAEQHQQQQQQQRRLPPRVEQFLSAAVAAAAAASVAAAVEATDAAPVAVDFGSMGLLGLLPRPTELAAVLQVVARRLQRRVLLLTAGWQPLLEACRALEAAAAGNGAVPRVLAVEQSLPHDALLPRCAALLHHGGAGTAAAALRCGTPQLVCPFHFDQRQWAERVEWLGCGTQFSPTLLLQQGEQQVAAAAAMTEQQQQRQQEVERAGEALAAAIAAVLQDGAIVEQCGRLQQQLAAEDGVAAAARLLQLHLRRCPLPEQPAAPAAARQAWAEADAAAAEQQQQQEEEAVELTLPGGVLGRPLRVACISPSEARFIHREVLEEDCYLARDRGLALPPGSVVLDVGANIGLFSLRLLLDPSLAPSVHRVHAFEPLPPVAAVLRRNLRAHGVEGMVAVHECGLHSSTGALPFTFFPAMPGNSTAVPAEKWAWQRPRMAQLMGAAAADAYFVGVRSYECPVTTLGAFIQEQGLTRIDLLKIDVEGSELGLLAGLDDAGWAAVRQLVAEVHDVPSPSAPAAPAGGSSSGGSPGGGGRVAEAQRLLEARGFAVHAEEQAGLPGNFLLFAWALA